jgi:hypothetical protein
MRYPKRILTGNLKGRNHLKEIDVEERVRLKWILEKYDVKM